MSGPNTLAPSLANLARAVELLDAAIKDDDDALVIHEESVDLTRWSAVSDVTKPTVSGRPYRVVTYVLKPFPSDPTEPQ